MEVENLREDNGFYIKDGWKNWCRIKGDVAEIRLTDGKVTTVDVKDLERAQEVKWHIEKGYARGQLGKRQPFLHNHLYNHFGYLLDHIDRNPLNNCESNFRSGEGGINASNKKARSKTGKLGVYKYSSGYKSSWINKNGITKTKHFAFIHYESEEKALEAASNYRNRKNNKAIQYHLDNKTKEAPKHTKRNIDYFIHNKSTKIRNLSIPKNVNYIEACIKIKKKRYKKKFHFKCESTKQEAIEKGKAYIEEVKKMALLK